MPSKTIFQVATSTTFQESKLVINEVGDYRVSRELQLNELPYDTPLYARVKHINDLTGESNWSPRVTFKVHNPASIIGVCLDSSVSPGSWSWIDANGNKVDSFNYTSHPTYANCTMSTVGLNAAACKMTSIPKFYVRTSPTGIPGSYSEGKKCWWISDLPTEGFRVHPAFKSSATTEVDTVMIATYQANAVTINDIETLGSEEGQSIANYIDYNHLLNMAAYKGTGWRIMNAYHVSLLRFLGIMAMGYADSEAVFGTNYASNSDPLSGSSNSKLILRGTDVSKVYIDDLWAMRNCICDYMFCIDEEGTLDLREPYGHGAVSVVFNTGDKSRYSITPNSVSATYFNDVLDCPYNLGSTTYDLMEFFIGKSDTYSDIESSAFKDTCEVVTSSDDPPYVLLVGDSWNHANKGAGLFHTSFKWSKGYNYRYNGTRLTYQAFE